MRCSNYKKLKGYLFFSTTFSILLRNQRRVYVTLQELIDTYEIPNIDIQFSLSSFSLNEHHNSDVNFYSASSHLIQDSILSLASLQTKRILPPHFMPWYSITLASKLPLQHVNFMKKEQKNFLSNCSLLELHILSQKDTHQLLLKYVVVFLNVKFLSQKNLCKM